MAEALITPNMITQDALMVLENSMVWANKVNTNYSKEFKKVGNTIDVRMPVAHPVQKDNLDITGFATDIEENVRSVVLDSTATTTWGFDPLDLTLTIEEYRKRYIDTAIIEMKDTVEQSLSESMDDYHGFSGTPGTPLSTFLSLAEAGAEMTDAGVPTMGRNAIHTPMTAARLADGLKNVFVQGKAKTAFEEASVGRYGGFQNYESVHALRHTVGAYGGTPLVNGAAQNVTYLASVSAGESQTIITDGWTVSVIGLLTKGDTITFAGVNSINPRQNKRDTGRLKTFRIKVDADSNATGDSTLTIIPAIITTGPYQNVTAAPADGAVISVVSGTASTSYDHSALFVPQTVTLTTRPLAPIESASWSETATGNMVSISLVKDFNFMTRREEIRLDMLYKVTTLRGETGHVITS